MTRPPQPGKDGANDYNPDDDPNYVVHVLIWRRGRDSNPRRPLSRSGFQDRRNRPLCHLSGLVNWQGGRESNPQPTVLETATLPIELPPYCRRVFVAFEH